MGFRTGCISVTNSYKQRIRRLWHDSLISHNCFSNTIISFTDSLFAAIRHRNLLRNSSKE